MIPVRRSRLVFVTSGFVLLLSSAVPAASQMDTGAIAGQIRVSRANFPPDRIEVTLETRGITVNESWTDNEGKFIFHSLPGNLYHVIINDEHYEPYQEDVKVEPHINPVNLLSITLKPRAQTKSDAQRPTIAGANPYLIDLTEYEKQFPKKAVKEFERGADAQAEGNNDEAIRHFQSALKLAPTFYPAHNNLGTAYLGQSNFTAAQAEFETVLKLKPSDTEAYFNLANVFLLTNNYDESLRMVEEGLRRQPNSGFGQFLLGSVYNRMGKLPEAERALRDAVRLDPSLSRAHLELVNLYLRQQRTQEATDELKYFLKAFPSDPFAHHARQVLVRLESGSQEVSNPQ